MTTKYRKHIASQVSEKDECFYIDNQINYVYIYCVTWYRLDLIVLLFISVDIIEPPQTEFQVFSSPEPKAHGDLIVYQSIRCLCVCVLTFSNMNISATSGPIAIKFYLKHH